MKKKLALTITALLLVTTLLAGCGGSNVSPAGTTTADSTAESAATTTVPAIDNSKFAELKMVMTGPECEDYKRIIEMVNTKLKQDLNASLTVDFLDWSVFQTKYPLMFASGEEFDLCYTSNWCFYPSQSLKGAYLELNLDDVQKYMPRTYSNVTKDQWNGVKINGKIFMVPQTGLQFTGDHNVYLVRGDLMDKYGISQIKTAADLTNYWDKVVANDHDIIPIAINASWWGYWITTSIMPYPWLGENYGNGFLNVYDVSDPNNVKNISDDEFWNYSIQRFKLAKEFQQKGYWSKDALTQTDDCKVMFQNGASATVISSLTECNNLYEIVNANHPDWKPTIVDINPDMPSVFYPITGDGMALHATTKNKERAMQVLDIISYDQVYYDLIYYGVEGEDYTLNSDTSYTKIGDGVNVGFRGMNNKLSRISTSVAPNFKELLDRFTKNGMYPKLHAFNFDATSVSAVDAAMRSVEAKYDPILQMGFADDVDAMVAEYRKGLDAAGIKDFQKEFTAQVAKYIQAYGK